MCWIVKDLFLDFQKDCEKPPKNCVETGPKGFEPLTTWLKARRSAELSYGPTAISIIIVTLTHIYVCE